MKVSFIYGTGYLDQGYANDTTYPGISTPILYLNENEWSDIQAYHEYFGTSTTYNSNFLAEYISGSFIKRDNPDIDMAITYVFKYLQKVGVYVPQWTRFGFPATINPFSESACNLTITTAIDVPISITSSSSTTYAGNVYIQRAGSTANPSTDVIALTGTKVSGTIVRVGNVFVVAPESEYPSLSNAVVYSVSLQSGNRYSPNIQFSFYRQGGTGGPYWESIIGRYTSIPSPETPDPNEQDPGGPSAPGGGEGNFDDTSDPIPLPDMPTISATDCGLVTAYRPTRQNLLDLGEYLYSPLLDLDTLKKLFDQPMQWLIGLNILPFSPTTGGSKEIKFAAFGTGVTSDYCTQQYHQIDCGEVEVKEYWGSALDYSPNTRAYLWLPFIGFVQVDVDIIMGSTCKVVYRVDILTGACIAVLMVNGSAVNHWTGQCASNIPLSASDYSRVIGSLLSVAGTAIGSAAAIGGALGALSNAGTAVAGATEAVKGATTAAGAAGANRALDVATTNQSVARGNAASTIAGGVTNTVSNVMGAKLGVQMSGSISGNAGLLDVQKPYFMFIRPRQSLAENYKHYVGYPSNMYASVESCKGYTKFEQIELTGIEATDGEIAEIAQVLKGGFYG